MSRWLVDVNITSVAVAMIWLACGSAAWLAWGPIPQPIDFTGKVNVQPDVVPQGGVVTVTREFVVHTPVSLVVTRNLVPIGNPRRPVYALAESRVLWKPGRYDNPRAHEIPDYVMPGRYRMDVVGSWQSNFLRHEVRELTPVEFTVVAR